MLVECSFVLDDLNGYPLPLLNIIRLHHLKGVGGRRREEGGGGRREEEGGGRRREEEGGERGKRKEEGGGGRRREKEEEGERRREEEGGGEEERGGELGLVLILHTSIPAAVYVTSSIISHHIETATLQ